MAAKTPDVGTGTTFEFGTFITTGSLRITDIKPSGIEKATPETSHMLTTGGKTFMPGDLYDPGTFTVDFQHDTDFNWGNLLSLQTAQAWTITWPDGETMGGGSVTTPSNDSGAIFKGVEFNDTLEEVMTGTATFKLTGSITF